MSDLLTVIAIIDSLAAILTPVVAAVRKSARSASAKLFYRGQALDDGHSYYAKNSWALPGGNVDQSANLNSMDTTTKMVAVVAAYIWHISDWRYETFGLVAHNGSANFLFYDDHIEPRSRDDIPPASNQTAVFCHGDNAY